MSSLPDWLNTAVQEATRSNASDINKAVDVCLNVVQQHPEFQQWVNLLIYRAIRDEINDSRHKLNIRLKRDAGLYGGGQKVDKTDSKVIEVQETFYDLCIAGRVLGDVLGEEIPDLISLEQGKMNGHAKNRDLLIWLKSKVKAGVKVRNAVSANQLAKTWKTLEDKYSKKEATQVA